MKLISVVGMAALICSTMALADPNSSSRGGTMVRAFEVTTINQDKNPQAPGLTQERAPQRILDNAKKHLDIGPDATGAGRAEGVDRVARVERPERIERLDLATRAEIARAHRPDLPQRNGRR